MPKSRIFTAKKSTSKKSKGSKANSSSGGQFKVPSCPPSVSTKPWNLLTLVHIEKNIQEFYLSDLKKAFVKQCDSSGLVFIADVDIQLRVHGVKLWNLTGRSVSLTPYDFTQRVVKHGADQNGQDQLGGFTSVAPTNEVPRLGYSWPEHLRLEPLDVKYEGKSGSGDDVLLMFVTCSEQDEVCMHIHIDWRFPGPSIYAVSTNYARDISEKIKNINHRLNRWEEIVKNEGPEFIKLPIVGRSMQVTPLYPVPISSDQLQNRLDIIEKQLSGLSVDGSESSATFEKIDDASIL